jgi:16S rRNA processing protein RimM
MAPAHRSPIPSDTRRARLEDKSAPAAVQSLIRIGRIAGVHGLRGALRFRPDDPDSQTIRALKRIFIEAGGATTEFRVTGVSMAGRGAARIQLEGVSDIDGAEALKGAVVMAAESDLPPPAAHEFYYHQAVGCAVMLTDGTRLGTIAEVFSTGANDVFVVRGEGKEVLVPVIANVIKSIDIAGRRVVIEAVPGLLD